MTSRVHLTSASTTQTKLAALAAITPHDAGGHDVAGADHAAPSCWSKLLYGPALPKGKSFKADDELNLAGLLNVLDGVVDTPGRKQN